MGGPCIPGPQPFLPVRLGFPVGRLSWRCAVLAVCGVLRAQNGMAAGPSLCGATQRACRSATAAPEVSAGDANATASMIGAVFALGPQGLVLEGSPARSSELI